MTKNIADSLESGFEKWLPRPLHRLFFRCRSLPLFLCTLALIVAGPFLELRSALASVVAATMMVILVAVAAVFLRPSKYWFIFFGIASVILLCLLIAQVKGWYNPSDQDGFTLATLRTIFYSAIFMVEISAFGLLMRHALFNRSASGIDRVTGSICGYFLLALIWSTVFSLILAHQSDAVINSRSGESLMQENILYYSIITLTTQGYGDFVPKSQLARYVAAFEGMTGTLYLAVLVAGLLGVAQSGRKDRET